MLVCMLPMWQKPEGIFMAPTYTMGGSDSSHTRQGGIYLFFIKLTTMVCALLDKKLKKDRENNILGSVSADFSIDSDHKYSLTDSVFSTPKVLSRP